MFGRKAQPSKINRHLLPITEPTSPLLENYRRLYQKISYFHKEQKMRTFGVTSASVGEGKTLTSINLALIMAEDAGNRVALLDCDFRRPKVDQYLGLKTRRGLTDVIQERAALPEIMLTPAPERTNLKVLPLGAADGLSEKQVYSFLYERRMKPILLSLKDEFDYVVVDTPPILPIVDINYLAELFDGMLMVIRAGKTSRDIIQASLEQLDSKNVIGIVFNGTRLQLSSRYKYEYYSYYSPYAKKDAKKGSSQT